jgi:hypothetical protein
MPRNVCGNKERTIVSPIQPAKILLISKIRVIVSGNVTGNKKCVPYLTPERIQHHNQTMLIN